MQMKESAEFACSPEQLWPFLEDPDKLRLWMKGVLEDHASRGGPIGLGSKFSMKFRQGGKTEHYRAEILIYDRPKHLGLKMKGGDFQHETEMFIDFKLSDLGDGRTRLDYLENWDSAGALTQLVSPVVKLFNKMQLKGFFKTLRTLVEEKEGALISS
jgi:carbon monoxide dehydrogenase subunit G